MEITFTEIILFAWACVATAMWLKYREETKAAKLFLRALLKDEELRNSVVADYKKFMESQA